jgi:predicted GNAT family N-acyltransferase
VIELKDQVDPNRLDQLMELFAGQWWTAGRTRDDVEAMLRGSDLVFALIDTSIDRLVGFARVITDGIYLAMVLDVIVSENKRRIGLGRTLLDSIINHPAMVDVSSVELVCQPNLVPFYQRWGFTDQVGQSLMRRRTVDPALIS